MSDLQAIFDQVQSVAREMKRWAGDLEAQAANIRRTARQAQAALPRQGQGQAAVAAMDAAARRCQQAAASLIAAKSSAERFLAVQGKGDGVAPSRTPVSGTAQSRPSLSASKSEFADAEFKTAVGSAFFHRDDTKYRSAAGDVPSFPGEYVLDLHGSPDAVHLVGNDRDEQTLSAVEFAEVVRSSTAWSGGPIRLFACNTGEVAGGFAQQLANELRVVVTAPTDAVWSIGGGGQPIVTAPEFDSKTGRYRPKWPPTGRWVSFEPFSHQG